MFNKGVTMHDCWFVAVVTDGGWITNLLSESRLQDCGCYVIYPVSGCGSSHIGRMLVRSWRWNCCDCVMLNRRPVCALCSRGGEKLMLSQQAIRGMANEQTKGIKAK